MAHHRQEVRLGAVGLLGLLARADQLGDAALLLGLCLLQGTGQLVDVPGQVADLAAVAHRQLGMVVAALDRLHRLAHGADRLGQAVGQAVGEQQGQGQGQQRQQAGAQENLLLALAEGLVGHADHHPPQALLGGIGRRRGRTEQEGVVELDQLAQDRRLEDLDPHVSRAAGLLDIRQYLLVAVAYFDEAYVRRLQAGLQQAVEDGDVAGNHAVLGGRRQLVGDQLAGLGQLLVEILQAGAGEVGGQQQGQQQGRAQADEQGAGADVATAAIQDHRPFSQSCRRSACVRSSSSSMPSERATCGLLSTLKCRG
ncbi:hypothetical protein D3C78_498570 [compost metagenome]